MPSAHHQASAYSLHDQPDVALGLLEATGVELPEHDSMYIDSPKLRKHVTDLEADAIITLWRGDGPVLSVILEIQLGRMRDKVWAWPAYLGIQRLRRRCPVLLVVICLTTRMAHRCSQPIDLGHPGLVLKPIVIGPSQGSRAGRDPAARDAPSPAHRAGAQPH